MNKYSMNKMLQLVLCIVLIAAIVLNFTGCNSSSTAADSTANTSFTFIVVDLE